jgi:hypothetical protein
MKKFFESCEKMYEAVGFMGLSIMASQSEQF